LIERLNEGITGKLILICAPAGFGKTTILSDWVRQINMPVAWLSLDKEDNELSRFLVYLISALQTIEDGLGKTVQVMLQTPQPLPIESILTELINEVTTLSQDFILILDDYHVVEDNTIHEALTFLLDNLPPAMHLVITSRSDPLLQIPSLRAKGQITELRIENLRFTTQETTRFLNQVMGLALSEDDVAALESRTEGWIAGLHLAALSMQDSQDASGFISAFTGDDRYVVDYLVDEVLARRPEGTREFLLLTSVLDRMTGPLCDAVAGQEGGQDILERLEQANLFVVPLDNRRQWYRYHNLFADVLHHRLRRTWPDRIPELHRRASVWYEAQGDAGEAFRHALAAGDPERAANIIEPIGMKMIVESRLSRLLGWLAKLPDELIAARPWLCVSGAWANLLTGQMGDVERLLQFAEIILSETTSKALADHSQIYGHVTTIRAFFARWREGDITRSIELSQEASKYVPRDSVIARSALALNLGIANLEIGELTAAASSLDEAQSVAQKGNMHYVALAASYYLGQVQVRQGYLHQAAKTYRQALQLGIKWGGGLPLPATGYAHVGLSQVLYEWNDLNESLIHLTRGIELGERANEASIMLDGTLTLIELKRAQGEMIAASEALDRVQEILSKSTRAQVSSQLSAQQAQLWLAQDNLAAALRWARERENPIDDEVHYARMPEYLALSRVRIAQGRGQAGGSHLTDVSILLARLLEKAEAAGWTGSVIVILALQAMAFQARGEANQAILALDRSLSLGEPDGYVRVFMGEGEPMAALLREAASRGIFPAYIERVLASFEPVAAPAQAPTTASLIEPLSERERQVLQLLKTELSSPEIARELVVSVNTVRFHTKNIYRKLDVTNRRVAVRRAEELGL
jgi:LuxR family maltose regulon positive regulatory protein